MYVVHFTDATEGHKDDLLEQHLLSIYTCSRPSVVIMVITIITVASLSNTTPSRVSMSILMMNKMNMIVIFLDNIKGSSNNQNGMIPVHNSMEEVTAILGLVADLVMKEEASPDFLHITKSPRAIQMVGTLHLVQTIKILLCVSVQNLLFPLIHPT